MPHNTLNHTLKRPKNSPVEKKLFKWHRNHNDDYKYIGEKGSSALLEELTKAKAHSADIENFLNRLEEKFRH